VSGETTSEAPGRADVDFVVEYHGSVSLLRACSEWAQAWAVEHLPHDDARWAGKLVVEHRSIRDVIEGIRPMEASSTSDVSS
jgi:hypothetical protein